MKHHYPDCQGGPDCRCDDRELEERTPETVEVPSELLDNLLENSRDLLAEWSWKKDERAGNATQYEALRGDISRTEKLLK